ncbi:unnamed protein product [Euphydryas editha]|uniref:Uncharacterized protein n=1 Tax=Euphydryas editha TaxID=104508 RepID=A0AAU9TDL8_EUPED|nr:unnamed protein product [Euphydryas editha]
MCFRDKPQFTTALEKEWDQWASVDHNTESPDKMWDRAKSLISRVAKNTTLPAGARKRQHWMSDNTLALIEDRRRVKGLGVDGRTLNEKSAKLQAACRRDLNAHIQNICKEIEAHANKHESRDLHQKIRTLTRSLSSKTWAIENSQGETVTELEEISETWRKYCQSLFEDPQSQCFDSTEEWRQIVRRVTARYGTPQSSKRDEAHLVEELKAFIKASVGAMMDARLAGSRSACFLRRLSGGGSKARRSAEGSRDSTYSSRNPKVCAGGEGAGNPRHRRGDYGKQS